MEDSRGRGRPSATALCVTSIAGLAVSTSVLILLVPALFRSDVQVDTWVFVVLTALAAGFATGARYWRPPALRPDDR